MKDSGDDTITSGVTDSGGVVSFELDPGTYTVVETVQPGWRVTAPLTGVNAATVVVDSDQLTSIDFGNQELGFIEGVKYEDINGNQVLDENEPLLPGWTIFLVPFELHEFRTHYYIARAG